MKTSRHSTLPEAPARIDSVDALARLQRLMGAALFRELDADDDLQQKWTDGRSMSTVAESFIKSDERLGAFERVDRRQPAGQPSSRATSPATA